MSSDPVDLSKLPDLQPSQDTQRWLVSLAKFCERRGIQSTRLEFATLTRNVRVVVEVKPQVFRA